MIARAWIGILSLIVTAGMMLSCEDDGSPTGPVSRTIMYIDEPLVMQVSDRVGPSAIVDGHYVFDLSSDPLVREAAYNDLIIGYMTSTSCDEDHWVYDFMSETWDRIAPSWREVVCFDAFTWHNHLLSGRGFRAEKYLNDSTQMWVSPYSGAGYPCSVGAIRLNPRYSAVPLKLPDDSITGFSGMTFDGSDYWTVQARPPRLFRLSASGILLQQSVSPAEYPMGLAFDGEDLWLADGSDVVYRIGMNGETLCEFTVPTDYPGGLTWGAGRLWLSEYEGPHLRVFGIDATASCMTSSAVIIDTLNIGVAGNALAWDGQHLLVAKVYGASGTLYVVNTDGSVVTSYDWPVTFVQDITYQGGVLHVMCRGPRECWTDDLVIARFRLR